MDTKWTIDSAPKDGQTILLFRPGFADSVVTAFWSKVWMNWGIGGSPTHWMPLPPPPGETA